jgi:hypothetical protein
VAYFLLGGSDGFCDHRGTIQSRGRGRTVQVLCVQLTAAFRLTVIICKACPHVDKNIVRRSGFLPFSWEPSSTSPLTAAMEVMEDLEKSLSASLNLRLRLSLVVALLLAKYLSQPRIMLP